MTIEEFVDYVQSALTMSYALDKELPDAEVRRITQQCAKWFHRNYRYAQTENYWYIPFESMIDEIDNIIEPTNQNLNRQTAMSKVVELPCHIQTVEWVYTVDRKDVLNIGIYAPNLNIGLGITGQPYMTSYVTSIAELGVYRTVLENFSAMLDKLNKVTINHSYSQMDSILRLLGQVPYHKDLVIKTADEVPLEHLFKNDIFQKYVIGHSMIQMGLLLSRFTFNLPNGFNYNADQIISEGKEMVQKIEDDIKNITSSDWFFMV